MSDRAELVENILRESLSLLRELAGRLESLEESHQRDLVQTSSILRRQGDILDRLEAVERKLNRAPRNSPGYP